MTTVPGNITQITYGVGFGTVLAIVCSWQRNRSILWAMLHGIFSWIYVVYFALTREANERK
jgi:ABC-type Fe3+-siderophore transport system permease subunit